MYHKGLRAPKCWPQEEILFTAIEGMAALRILLSEKDESYVIKNNTSHHSLGECIVAEK